MGGGKFETVSVENTFKNIHCKVEQRNGVVAGRGSKVNSRFCSVLFENKKNNSKLVW